MKPNDLFNIYDQPIPYRRKQDEQPLLIYPVTMRDYIQFNFYARCLSLEKNSLTDPIEAIKAISMNRLEYMYFKSNNTADDETNLVALFDGLLRLVLKLSKETERNYFDYGYDHAHKPIFRIGEMFYDARDFNALREIIAEQNEYSLPNENIQKNVRDSAEEARRFKARMAGHKVAELEDQIISLSIYTGWPISEIYDMTIRKFVRAMKRANHMIYQEAYLKASLSGMVEFKDKSVISGWLADIDVEDNDDVFMDVGNLQSKVDFSEAKKK